MNTLTHEERNQALSKILSVLQDVAAHQTDKELKQMGVRDILEATQLTKRMLHTVEFERGIAEADSLDNSLGLSNIQ